MLAALSGFIAVAVGAFAAHGIKDSQARDWLRVSSLQGAPGSVAAPAGSCEGTTARSRPSLNASSSASASRGPSGADSTGLPASPKM